LFPFFAAALPNNSTELRFNMFSFLPPDIIITPPSPTVEALRIGKFAAVVEIVVLIEVKGATEVGEDSTVVVKGDTSDNVTVLSVVENCVTLCGKLLVAVEGILTLLVDVTIATDDGSVAGGSICALIDGTCNVVWGWVPTIASGIVVPIEGWTLDNFSVEVGKFVDNVGEKVVAGERNSKEVEDRSTELVVLPGGAIVFGVIKCPEVCSWEKVTIEAIVDRLMVGFVCSWDKANVGAIVDRVVVGFVDRNEELESPEFKNVNCCAVENCSLASLNVHVAGWEAGKLLVVCCCSGVIWGIWEFLVVPGNNDVDSVCMKSEVWTLVIGRPVIVADVECIALEDWLEDNNSLVTEDEVIDCICGLVLLIIVVVVNVFPHEGVIPDKFMLFISIELFETDFVIVAFATTLSFITSSALEIS
jgi:hypothetical protein